MHAEALNIDIQETIDTPPMKVTSGIHTLCYLMIAFGVVVFAWSLFSGNTPGVVWGSYYTSFLFFMGISVGAVMTTPIVQIVRATWCVPIRRIAEAHIAFLPVAFFLFLGSYLGKDYLFPWATEPMPGREWWMQPNFVYLRFAVLFLLFFYFLYRFTRISLRSDIAMVREKATDKEMWKGGLYQKLSLGWGGEKEILSSQWKMSVLAPVVVACYAIVWTLFATEMIVGMDKIWFSNMFGGFQFLGNIYMGWAALALFSFYYASKNGTFAKLLRRQVRWDLGMLCFGFCMLWGYTFFSQFLPQWYSNMPEETQWLFIRTREVPWKTFGYVAFCCAFVIPFITLLSEDVKKNPWTMSFVALIIFVGVWFEKYVIVMPQISPDAIPFGLVDIGIFVAMLGMYILSILWFMARFPMITVSHPQAQNETKSW